MSKVIKYGTNLAIIGGIGNGVANIIKQLNKMEVSPETKFDWKSLFLAIGKGGLIGGGIGMAAGAIVDYQNSLESPLNTDILLVTLAHDIRLKKEDKTYVKLSEKANLLIQFLSSHFSSELATSPLKGGSSEKGTALRDQFDIDIFLSFKSGSFRSTATMMRSLFDILEKNKQNHSISKLRQQEKSVGAFFAIDGKEFKIDVVPCKLTKSNCKKTYGYLHKHKKSLFIDSSSYTKTDIPVLHSIRLTPTQQEILILLKAWKKKNDLPISSYLLQNLLLDAYKHHRVPRAFTKKVILVFQHIADYLDVAVIRGIENSNNILTNIPALSKAVVIQACKDAIEEYQYQPNTIVKLVS